VKLLVDTHALLWAATDPDRLAPSAREALEDGEHAVGASVVVAWEIAIKQSLGKLELPKPAEVWLPTVLRRTGIDVVELGLGAALRVRTLPWHHRDPFDRLLVAHALDGGFAIVTRDAVFHEYGVDVIQA
jgi:PIN domain nuclease of toxin-antitoxin system